MDSSTKILCLECDVIFLSKVEIAMHLGSVHIGQSLISCKRCTPISWMKDTYLQNHERIFHRGGEKSGLKELVKPKQGKLPQGSLPKSVPSVTKPNIAVPKPVNSAPRHKQTDTGEKSFKCSFCENVYTKDYNMKRHVKRSHTEETPKASSAVPKTSTSAPKTSISVPKPSTSVPNPSTSAPKTSAVNKSLIVDKLSFINIVKKTANLNATSVNLEVNSSTGNANTKVNDNSNITKKEKLQEFNKTFGHLSKLGISVASVKPSVENQPETTEISNTKHYYDLTKKLPGIRLSKNGIKDSKEVNTSQNWAELPVKSAISAKHSVDITKKLPGISLTKNGNKVSKELDTSQIRAELQVKSEISAKHYVDITKKLPGISLTKPWTEPTVKSAISFTKISSSVTSSFGSDVSDTSVDLTKNEEIIPRKRQKNSPNVDTKKTKRSNIKQRLNDSGFGSDFSDTSVDLTKNEKSIVSKKMFDISKQVTGILPDDLEKKRQMEADLIFFREHFL